MKRKLVIAALALGTVGGFTAGFASMCHHKRSRHHNFEKKVEQKVTDICANAVKKAQATKE